MDALHHYLLVGKLHKALFYCLHASLNVRLYNDIELL